MKILTLKKQTYRGCAIYIRHFGTHFEYLLIFKKRLYTNSMTVAPHWYKRFSKELYSKEQMTKIIEILFSAASITIDQLINPNSVDKDNKNQDV